MRLVHPFLVNMYYYFQTPDHVYASTTFLSFISFLIILLFGQLFCDGLHKWWRVIFSPASESPAAREPRAVLFCRSGENGHTPLLREKLTLRNTRFWDLSISTHVVSFIVT
jgi:hypothetical protein